MATYKNLPSFTAQFTTSEMAVLRRAEKRQEVKRPLTHSPFEGLKDFTLPEPEEEIKEAENYLDKGAAVAAFFDGKIGEALPLPKEEEKVVRRTFPKVGKNEGYTALKGGGFFDPTKAVREAMSRRKRTTPEERARKEGEKRGLLFARKEEIHDRKVKEERRKKELEALEELEKLQKKERRTMKVMEEIGLLLVTLEEAGDLSEVVELMGGKEIVAQLPSTEEVLLELQEAAEIVAEL
jgi:hypothetical protein